MWMEEVHERTRQPGRGAEGLLRVLTVLFGRYGAAARVTRKLSWSKLYFITMYSLFLLLTGKLKA